MFLARVMLVVQVVDVLVDWIYSPYPLFSDNVPVCFETVGGNVITSEFNFLPRLHCQLFCSRFSDRQ